MTAINCPSCGRQLHPQVEGVAGGCCIHHLLEIIKDMETTASPQDFTQECDLCHEVVSINDLVLNEGDQLLCPACRKE